MLKLRDIMTRDVVTIDPTLSIRDAMELVGTRHVGGAPVVAGGKVVGVISMTDLVQFAASSSVSPTDRAIDAVWEEPEPAADGDVAAEAAFFAEAWSDAGADIVEPSEGVAGSEWRALDEHTVSEVMTRDVRSLPPGTAVVEAAALMTKEGIHRVLVTDCGQLVGIVSLTDIAKAVAEHKFSTRTRVFANDADFDDRGSERAPLPSRPPQHPS